MCNKDSQNIDDDGDSENAQEVKTDIETEFHLFSTLLARRRKREAFSAWGARFRSRTMTARMIGDKRTARIVYSENEEDEYEWTRNEEDEYETQKKNGKEDDDLHSATEPLPRR
jgi:hypothetical protein